MTLRSTAVIMRKGRLTMVEVIPPPKLMEAEILSNGGPLKVSLGCAECQDDKLKDSEMFLSGEGLFQYYENGAERVSAA